MPLLPITEDFEVMPSAKLILTPYGVLEKCLTVHMVTDYTVAKVSFGFGKEFETAEVFSPAIKKYTTYYGELVVNKVFMINQLNLGLTLAGWKQPELFTNTP